MTQMETAYRGPSNDRLWRRIAQPMFEDATYASWAYLLTGLPLGVLWFALLLPLYVAGAALTVVWIGLGLLALAQGLSRLIGMLERWLAIAALGSVIPAPEPVSGVTLSEKGRVLLTDEFGWRVFLWSFVRLFTGILGFVIAIVAFVVPIALTIAPVSYVWGAPPPDWEWTLWVAPLLGIPAFFGAAHVVRGMGRIDARLAEMVLGSSRSTAVQEASQRAERAEEQLRIDQELHDSIGHVLTMNVVQAGAGAHVFEKDPEFAREALTNIERRGREALAELDRIIGLVREDDLSREPLPGFGDIDDLVSEIREAGMDIDSHIEPIETVPEVGRAAYRVVQEALTNVAKHAPGASTRVSVTGTDGWLVIEIVNAAPPARPVAVAAGTGSGLAGIRQRVAILGGHAESGPTDDGGFRLYASFPDAAKGGT